MNNRRLVAIALVASMLIVAFPFASFIATNHEDADFNVLEFANLALPYGAAAWLVIVALSFAVSKLFRQVAFDRFLLSASVAFFLLFLFKPVSSLLGGGALGIAGYCVLFAVVVSAAFFIFRYKDPKVAALIFAVISLAIPGPKVASAFASLDRTAVAAPDKSVAVANANLPNIYYVIVDAYSTTATLKKRFDFDSSEFIRSMEAQGFYHADHAYASYNRTILTLGSIMTSEYYPVKDYPKTQLYPRLMRESPVPGTIEKANALGYQFYVVGNYWGPCRGPHVRCLDEETDAIPYEMRTLLDPTPFPLLQETLFSSGEPQGVDVDAIGKTIAGFQRGDLPKRGSFTFIHHLSPHPPYQFKPDCSIRDQFDFDFSAWSKQSRALFIDNLVCTNKRIIELTNLIAEKDPTAMVVFQGDHGSAFSVKFSRPFKEWSEDAILERSTILNLVRIPESCRQWLWPYINNINTVRLLLGCAAGERPDFLENRSYLSSYNKNKDPKLDALYELTLPSSARTPGLSADVELLALWAEARRAYEKALAAYQPLLDEWKEKQHRLKQLRNTEAAAADVSAGLLISEIEALRKPLKNAQQRFYNARKHLSEVIKLFRTKGVPLPLDDEENRALGEYTR